MFTGTGYLRVASRSNGPAIRAGFEEDARIKTRLTENDTLSLTAMAVPPNGTVKLGGR
jgi:hypothetical protein